MHMLSLLGEMTSDYSDPYYTNSTDTASAAAILGFMAVFMLGVLIVTYVISALCLGRIFAKAGVESWKAWVPIYNNWVMLELGGQKGFWAILSLVPFVNIVSVVFMYIAMYHIGRSFGKDDMFVVLAILLPLVWMIWLAVDHSTWKGAPVAANATPPTPPPAPQA